MIKGGYYIKARKIQDSEIARQPPHVREIWDWLLKEANHTDSKYSGFTIKRGQLFRTYNDIREGLHWMIGWRKMVYNENQTKKAMKFLRSTGMIDTKKELGGVLITICNYEYYQDPKNYERTNEGTIEGTNEEPMKNQTLPYNNKKKKNDKNDKKEKKKYNTIFLSQIKISDFPELDSEYLEIAKSFQKLFIKNLKEKNISSAKIEKAKGSWIDDIRLLFESDKFNIEDCRTIFMFLQKDDFWKANIQSTSKLREKFPQLLAKARSEKNTNNDEMDQLKQKIFKNITNG